MLAYIFWHVPFADIDVREYETALLVFHTHHTHTHTTHTSWQQLPPATLGASEYIIRRTANNEIANMRHRQTLIFL